MCLCILFRLSGDNKWLRKNCRFFLLKVGCFGKLWQTWIEHQTCVMSSITTSKLLRIFILHASKNTFTTKYEVEKALQYVTLRKKDNISGNPLCQKVSCYSLRLLRSGAKKMSNTFVVIYPLLDKIAQILKALCVPEIISINLLYSRLM